MSSGYYPAGAENDPRAPWNNSDTELVPREIEYSCVMKRKAIVDVTDYIPGEIEKEWDGESYVAVRVDDDFSGTNWLEEFKDTWRTPLELINVLRRTAKDLMKGNMPDKDTFYWVNIIDECESWTIDYEEAEAT